MSSNKLNARQLSRYSRHILLPEVGREGQEKLAAARILVIGAGGLGSPAALYLAAAGVGALGVADFDLVEEHNLQRQIIHDTAAVGKSKTESARSRLLALNPEIEVELHREGITPQNSLELFRRYDLIVDGSDNFGARYLNNDAAFLSRKPLIYGSIFRFEGQVSLFHSAGGGPCYRCLFPSAPPPGAVPNCAEAGVFGALCGMIGSMQAMEAIKHVLGTGDSLRGKLLVIDALGTKFRTLHIKKDPDCPLCGASPSIRSIEAETYQTSCDPSAEPETMTDQAWPLQIDVVETRRILDTDAGAILLDVREPHELEICRIPGSLPIPMGAVPQNLDRLPRDKPILVQCHHGGRSMQVTRFLRDQGFARVSNIAGGIDAWAEQFDPAMQRY